MTKTRDLINSTNIEAFTQWLLHSGWELDHPRTQWEILRMYKKPLEPVIVYTRKNNESGIFTIHGETEEQARQFLAELSELAPKNIEQDLIEIAKALVEVGGPDYDDYDGGWKCRSCNKGSYDPEEIQHQVYPKCNWIKAQEILNEKSR